MPAIPFSTNRPSRRSQPIVKLPIHPSQIFLSVAFHVFQECRMMLYLSRFVERRYRNIGLLASSSTDDAAERFGVQLRPRRAAKNDFKTERSRAPKAVSCNAVFGGRSGAMQAGIIPFLQARSLYRGLFVSMAIFTLNEWRRIGQIGDLLFCA